MTHISDSKTETTIKLNYNLQRIYFSFIYFTYARERDGFKPLIRVSLSKTNPKNFVFEKSFLKKNLLLSKKYLKSKLLTRLNSS
jgi:hypothetical protein